MANVKQPCTLAGMVLYRPPEALCSSESIEILMKMLLRKCTLELYSALYIFIDNKVTLLIKNR